MLASDLYIDLCAPVGWKAMPELPSEKGWYITRLAKLVPVHASLHRHSSSKGLQTLQVCYDDQGFNRFDPANAEVVDRWKARPGVWRAIPADTVWTSLADQLPPANGRYMHRITIGTPTMFADTSEGPVFGVFHYDAEKYAAELAKESRFVCNHAWAPFPP